jgi:hypothetical protein
MAIEVRSDIYNIIEIGNLEVASIPTQSSGIEELGTTIANTITKNEIIELVNKSNSFTNNKIKI